MGLSSNVMNMKFMQKASDKTKPEEQPEGKKVKDVSEWSLPSGSIKPKIKPTVTINSVGYGSIASLTAQDEESDSEETSKPKTTPLPEQSTTPEKVEAQAFLSGILDKAQKDKKKDKKRSSKDDKRPKKKAKTSLS
ncbi:hypothetical protein OXX79_002848 [Metschnikowia pulcherrima]